jgi:hypothetical protein
VSAEARAPSSAPGVTETGLARSLTSAYAGRLAPAFVRRVLAAEVRRSPTRPPELIDRLIRSRLDAWLAEGRYPLSDEEEDLDPTPPRPSSRG